MSTVAMHVAYLPKEIMNITVKPFIKLVLSSPKLALLVDLKGC